MCLQPYTSGGRGAARHGDSRGSRESTIQNARRHITQVAVNMRLPSQYGERALRLYQMALSKNFTFGRRQTHIVATCLYIVCRQDKSPYLLIDFSDALQVNVFVLGTAYLQFTHMLNMELKVVDPSLYIHRFASRLDFGDKLSTVVTTALRVVTRMKKDWIELGRRPDGVSAAALLIAARAHKFNVDQAGIARLFRVTSDTLRGRLCDFRATPSAQLTLEQFNVNDLDLDFDPPAFINAQVLSMQAARSSVSGSGSGDNYDGGGALVLNLPPADGADPTVSTDGGEEGFAVSELAGDAVFQIQDDYSDSSEDDEESKQTFNKIKAAAVRAKASTATAKAKDTAKGSTAPAGFVRTKVGNVNVNVAIPGHQANK